MANCCGEDVFCDKLVTIGYLNDLVNASKLKDTGCITIPTTSITQFTCCPIPQGETSGITPTYNWLNSNDMPKRVIFDDPSQDINGFVIENNTQSDNFCDGNSVVGGNMCVPQSDVRFEYTSARTNSITIVTSPRKCTGEYAYREVKSWIRYSVYCSSSTIIESGTLVRITGSTISRIATRNIEYNVIEGNPTWQITIPSVTITSETSGTCSESVTSTTSTTQQSYSLKLTPQSVGTIPCDGGDFNFIEYSGNACTNDLILRFSSNNSDVSFPDGNTWSSPSGNTTYMFRMNVGSTSEGGDAFTVTISDDYGNDFVLNFERESCQMAEGCCLFGKQDIDNWSGINPEHTIYYGGVCFD